MGVFTRELINLLINAALQHKMPAISKVICCCTYATYSQKNLGNPVIYLLLRNRSPMITISLPGSAQRRRPKLKAIPN